MPFSDLVGNERIKKLLRRAVSEGRVGQSLIMAGPHGIGKRQFALALAAALNCDNPIDGDACGNCIPCRKVAAGEHTDVVTITPEGQFIKVAQMREMSFETQFRPYEGRRRVSIIDDADRLKLEAANSILKVLEEPPESSLLILVTSQPYALLDTIRSRCLFLSFAPLSAPDLESYLAANYKRPQEETRLQARLAGGSIGRALGIDLGEYRAKRSLMLDLTEALVNRDALKLMSLAEHLGRKLEKDEFEDHLDIFLIVLSDLLHLKVGETAASLPNADVAPRLESINESATMEQLMDWPERVELVLQSLKRNVNRQLATEAMLLGAI